MSGQDSLARRLGTGDAVVIGLGSMIGAGVFAAFAPAAEAALVAAYTPTPERAEACLALAGVRRLRGEPAAATALIERACRLEPGRFPPTQHRLADLARRMVSDAYPFDQRACSSPRAVVWRGADPQRTAQARERFWLAVAAELDRRSASAETGSTAAGLDALATATDLVASRDGLTLDAFRADPVGATRSAPIDAAPADIDRLVEAVASVLSRGYGRR